MKAPEIIVLVIAVCTLLLGSGFVVNVLSKRRRVRVDAHHEAHGDRYRLRVAISNAGERDEHVTSVELTADGELAGTWTLDSLSEEVNTDLPAHGQPVRHVFELPREWVEQRARFRIRAYISSRKKAFSKKQKLDQAVLNVIEAASESDGEEPTPKADPTKEAKASKPDPGREPELASDAPNADAKRNPTRSGSRATPSVSSLEQLYVEGLRMQKAASPSARVSGAGALLYGSPPTEADVDRWQGEVRASLPGAYRRRFQFAPLHSRAMRNPLTITNPLETEIDRRLKESLGELQRIMAELS